MENDLLEEVTLNSGQVIRAHKKSLCEPPCAIHAPSDHHMKDWKLIFRESGMLERICPHGIGHPDPDTMSFVKRRLGKEISEYEGVHGCDGCCVLVIHETKLSEAEEDAMLAMEYNKGT